MAKKIDFIGGNTSHSVSFQPTNCNKPVDFNKNCTKSDTEYNEYDDKLFILKSLLVPRDLSNFDIYSDADRENQWIFINSGNWNSPRRIRLSDVVASSFTVKDYFPESAAEGEILMHVDENGKYNLYFFTGSSWEAFWVCSRAELVSYDGELGETVSDALDEIWASYAKKQNAYDSIKEVEPYTYETLYTDLDYDFAKEWFINNEVEPGACSSFRKGNWYGRSYDWQYNNDATFVVRTPRIGNRFATIGVSGYTKTLTKQFVDSKAYSELYKIVPFRIVDGFNEYGVFCNTNVVPNQKNHISGTTPLIEQRDEICDMMLPRYILDNFKSATEAVEYIRDYVSIIPNRDLLEEHNYDLHVMVLDNNKTYVLEFVGDQVVIIENNAMTNFFVSDVDFDNNKVYTPEDHNVDPTKDPATMGITSFGAGLERYNLIIDNINSVNSKQTAENLLGLLRYTNAYKTATSPRWYTEVVGEYPEGSLTVSTSLPILETAWQAMKATFDTRSRDTGNTWQTVHSSVYDIKNKILYLENQESGIRTEYSFDYYTAEQTRKYVEEHGGSGNVDDVQVDDVSVVDENKIAHISFNGLATEEFVTSQGYITGITGDDVTTALGYEPYNKENPDGYQTEAQVETAITSKNYTTMAQVEAKGYATETYVNNHHDSTKEDTISDLSDIRSGASKGATAVQPSDISDMATKTWVGGQGYQNSSQVDTTISNHNSSASAHQDIRNSIPDELADLTDDSTHRLVTDTEKTTWSSKQDTMTANNGIVKTENNVGLTQTFYDYLVAQTFVKPTISSFTMTNAGTYEIGASISCPSFKHTETNIDNFNGKLTLRKTNASGTIIESNIEPKTTNTTVTLSSPQTITSSTTYYLHGIDALGNTVSKTSAFTINTYAYSKLTSSTTAPTSGLTKEVVESTFKSNGKAFTYTAGDYLYLYGTSSTLKVQTNVMGQWVDVAYDSLSSSTITLANGTTKIYYVYRVGTFASSGTATYRIC